MHLKWKMLWTFISKFLKNVSRNKTYECTDLGEKKVVKIELKLLIQIESEEVPG
jgi:hypothetical protein